MVADILALRWLVFIVIMPGFRIIMETNLCTSLGGHFQIGIAEKEDPP